MNARVLAFFALVCLTSPAKAAYWNLFNLEGESALSAVFATYATLTDMLGDENRTGTFPADGNAPFGANIVGTGSDEMRATSVPEPSVVSILALSLLMLLWIHGRRRLSPVLNRKAAFPSS